MSDLLCEECHKKLFDERRLHEAQKYLKEFIAEPCVFHDVPLEQFTNEELRKLLYLVCVGLPTDWNIRPLGEEKS